MKPKTDKIKISEVKSNIVLIGDIFNVMDTIEIYLYKDFNVIATINEFDGMKKIRESSPVCVFIKVPDNISPLLSFIARMKNENYHNIPIVAFSKSVIPSINEFVLQKAGIAGIIKFPITQQEFLNIFKIVMKENDRQEQN
jgi:DNA-binding NtrC family response regulator